MFVETKIGLLFTIPMAIAALISMGACSPTRDDTTTIPVHIINGDGFGEAYLLCIDGIVYLKDGGITEKIDRITLQPERCNLGNSKYLHYTLEEANARMKYMEREYELIRIGIKNNPSLN